MKKTPEITEEIKSKAKKMPNAYLYTIDGNFKESDYIPPEKIIGAWKVDQNGDISGEFIHNPQYKENT